MIHHPIIFTATATAVVHHSVIPTAMIHHPIIFTATATAVVHHSVIPTAMIHHSIILTATATAVVHHSVIPTAMIHHIIILTATATAMIHHSTAPTATATTFLFDCLWNCPASIFTFSDHRIRRQCRAIQGDLGCRIISQYSPACCKYV